MPFFAFSSIENGIPLTITFPPRHVVLWSAYVILSDFRQIWIAACKGLTPVWQRIQFALQFSFGIQGCHSLPGKASGIKVYRGTTFVKDVLLNYVIAATPNKNWLLHPGEDIMANNNTTGLIIQIYTLYFLLWIT
ncbi:hypothetical protein AWV79_33655 [Cupriavidus sp. UYMMa02A]|nr:hypothetical protein AWV79_33655 [Cupriavidus sp. UYMMa02A]